MSSLPPPRLDALDQLIVERLAQNARQSNRSIATDLGVTEGTIRTRIRRLQDERLIEFAVVSDFRMAGSPNLCMFGIDADPAYVTEVTNALNAMEKINCVVLLLGRFSILAMGLFTNVEKLHQFTDEYIRCLPGVRHVHTSISIHNLKYEAGLAKIDGNAGHRVNSASAGAAISD